MLIPGLFKKLEIPAVIFEVDGFICSLLQRTIKSMNLKFSFPYLNLFDAESKPEHVHKQRYDIAAGYFYICSAI